MMLRSRAKNTNVGPVDTKQKRKHEIQGDVGQVISTEPQPKKAPSKGLTELSDGISEFVIDSTKRMNKSKEDKENAPTDEQEVSLGRTSGELAPVLDPADPCPQYDFDAEEGGKLESVSEYAVDIFRYYKAREKNFRIRDYMDQHLQLSPKIRAILVDWLVELQESFELNHETMYNAVKIVDMYLDKTSDVSPDDLQRIACGALYLACKYDERSPPAIEDIIYMANDKLNREQLFAMEREVFEVINFDLGSPLGYRYLRRLGRVCRVDMPTLTLARYLLEMSLLVYEYAQVAASRMAAAAFLLSMKMIDNNYKWNPILEKYSGYKGEDIVPLMEHLNHSIHYFQKDCKRLISIHEKYAHEVFFKVAKVPLLKDSYDEKDIPPLPKMSFP